MPSAHVISHNEHLLLIDCGEGTQLQLQRYGLRTSRLDAIFISHLHGDHVYGLPGLLTTLSIQNRTRRLRLVGPKGLAELLQTLFQLSHSRLNYPLDLQELTPGMDWPVPVYTEKGVSVQAFPLQHRVPCYGYRVEELPKARQLLVDSPLLAGVPKVYYRLIKLGNDITLSDGRTLQADDVLGPRPRTASYAYCSDTRYNAATAAFVRGVDLLYHEATFLDELKARAEETQHSTALEAALFAGEAHVKQLLIGHYSARYSDLSPLLAEARSVFPATELAREGLQLSITPT